MARRSIEKLPKKNIYRIILTSRGGYIKNMCSDVTEEKVMKKLNHLLKDNKKVVFPRRYLVWEHFMHEADYELVIIKVKQEDDSDVTRIKDNYGKYTEYRTSNKNWIVVNRSPYDIEETFWVYGYHPRLGRKDFKWIFENFVADGARDKMQFRSIQVFLNKVLFDINGKLEMVICKNHSDAVRMYNLIQQWAQKRKFKYIAFMGDVRQGNCNEYWVERIMKHTNWSHHKATRISTRE